MYSQLAQMDEGGENEHTAAIWLGREPRMSVDFAAARWRQHQKNGVARKAANRQRWRLLGQLSVLGLIVVV
ncbi:unnamed protein product [Bursaphelenchus okinawaensis]|uniref:Uncharacterized protein n=1 Tax=Bursaphelenchus okinawaensis TaxID=465554 RepID=A0A811K136_9BILA|nr:unnamed protein product [Bursaphelenchus okinawaensis]CAG9088588.1 unnamed protein product [Bursaphelenchus okinawaensis]